MLFVGIGRAFCTAVPTCVVGRGAGAAMAVLGGGLVAGGDGAVTAVLTFGTMAVVVALVVGFAAGAGASDAGFGAWMVFDVKAVRGAVAARFLRASSSGLLMYVAMVTILQGKRRGRERHHENQTSK